jgi:amino acid permease
MDQILQLLDKLLLLVAVAVVVMAMGLAVVRVVAVALMAEMLEDQLHQVRVTLEVMLLLVLLLMVAVVVAEKGQQDQLLELLVKALMADLVLRQA